LPEIIPSLYFELDSAAIFSVKPPTLSAGEVYIIEVKLKDELAN
jgi:hypothetical protein